MSQINVYVTNWCPYCHQAKMLLESIDVKWNEINIEKEGITRSDLLDLTGQYTVPQIIIDGKAIGGYTDLFALHSSGKLRDMLASAES